MPSSGCPPWLPDAPADPAGDHERLALLHHVQGRDPSFGEIGSPLPVNTAVLGSPWPFPRTGSAATPRLYRSGMWGVYPVNADEGGMIGVGLRAKS